MWEHYIPKDVIISVGEERFPCHKSVLVSRSLVFKTMFDAEMKESKENHVQIDDTDPACMKEMLSYIYTGKATPELGNNACGVLALAEKYQLLRLKDVCSEVLSKQLTLESACDILALSDLHGADQLKVTSMEFVARNLKQIRKTEGYSRLKGCDPKLIMSILDEVAENTSGPDFV